MNRIHIVGHVGREPEIKYTQSGSPVANYTIASKHKYKDKEETTWFNLASWGKQAEFVQGYITKGSKIAIMGRIKTDSWEKDGQTIYRDKVMVEHIELMSKVERRETVDTEYKPEVSASYASDDIPF